MSYTLLNKIDSPADLKALKLEELPLLCRELRDFIVESLSTNPGHLASSLGAIELTVALHYVYDTPADKLVWDVGHQAYSHKILTGRRDAFCTNRKFKGLRPFPSPQESEYDTFTCGHASNSISAALGMAVAEMAKKELLGADENKVVAIIGDGAMSGGLAFEGLNNVGAQPNNILIVLNDNHMSIDRSVGGLKDYLLHLNTNTTYNRLRFKVANWLHGKGVLDEGRKKRIIRFSNSLKALISRQQNIFEGMDIRYFGPYDGHNVTELVRVLREIKDMTGPRLLHLHTVKGKGYEPAEKEATIWHAPGKFDPETGDRATGAPTTNNQQPTATDQQPPKYQDVFGETLLELARQNDRIVGVTPAMPTGCSMNIMMKEMPRRAFDVGIAEGHAVTFSAGMAKEGLIPFCNIYSSFAQRAYDNIIHDVAIQGLPVVICLDRAGLVGEDGATHHGAFDLAYLRPIPNTIIASPMNEHELRNLMYTAQKTDHGPFVIRYPRGSGEIANWRCPFQEIEIGKGRRIRTISGQQPTTNDQQPTTNDQQPTTVALLTLGPLGNVAARAAERAEQAGIGVAHYDMRFLKPLDEDIMREVAEGGFSKIITIEDGSRIGGLGSAVMEWMNEYWSSRGQEFKGSRVQEFKGSRGQTSEIIVMGLPDEFIEHGSVAELRKLVHLDEDAIYNEIIRQTI